MKAKEVTLMVEKCEQESVLKMKGNNQRRVHSQNQGVVLKLEDDLQNLRNLNCKSLVKQEPVRRFPERELLNSSEGEVQPELSTTLNKIKSKKYGKVYNLE